MFRSFSFVGITLCVLLASATQHTAEAAPPEVEALIKQLSDKDDTARLKAAKELGKLKEKAKDAIPALMVASTDDADEDVREVAKKALAAIKGATEIEMLVKNLKAKEPENRIKALLRIAAFGADAVGVSDSVIEAMRDKEKSVQDAAAETLNKVNPDGALIALCVIGLQTKEPKARIKTLEQIAALGPGGKIVSEFVIEAMLDKGEGVQAAAFKTLEQVNPPIHPHVVAIFRGSPDERRKALASLAELGLDAECTVPLLLVCNDKPKLWGSEPHFDLFPTIAKIAPKNRRFAAAVLGCIATPNSGAETTLTARRLAGIAQLDVIQATVDQQVAALSAAMSDNHTLPQVFKAWEKIAPKDKQFAAAVLGCISGPRLNVDRLLVGVAYLDAIEATIEEKVAALRAATSAGYTFPQVFKAWEKIAPKDKRYAAAVLGCVVGRSPYGRLVGIAQLDGIEATDEEKVAALLVAMNDNIATVEVFKALEKLAPKDQRFAAATEKKVRELLAAINDSEETKTFFHAVAVLSKIAPRDKQFATVVLDAVARPNTKGLQAIQDRRLAAIAQLNVIGATAQQKVDALVVAMSDKGTLPAVVKALVEYGANAKSALPALRELKASPNEAVRNAAITAIAKIETAVEAIKE